MSEVTRLYPCFFTGACTSSPVLAFVCGSNNPVVEDDTGLYYLVEFRTDSSVVNLGFELFYYIGKFRLCLEPFFRLSANDPEIYPVCCLFSIISLIRSGFRCFCPHEIIFWKSFNKIEVFSRKQEKESIIGAGM